MATRTKAATATAKKAGKAASEARSNPYVQRFIEDPELRDNVREAFDAIKHAYKRVSNGKPPAKALMEDKKVQRELRTAAESLREAADTLRGAKKRRKRGHGRLLVLALVGAGLALVLSEGLRKKVLDALFGAEEEFEYTSTTPSPTPAPAPAGTSS